ncbi:hypothetical protein C8J56DRAFT_904418 [Mycena floridula]|nr:hypothetical protein C8J56DRAFT_904418 [Mycena floridula]
MSHDFDNTEAFQKLEALSRSTSRSMYAISFRFDMEELGRSIADYPEWKAFRKASRYIMERLLRAFSRMRNLRYLVLNFTSDPSDIPQNLVLNLDRVLTSIVIFTLQGFSLHSPTAESSPYPFSHFLYWGRQHEGIDSVVDIDKMAWGTVGTGVYIPSLNDERQFSKIVQQLVKSYHRLEILEIFVEDGIIDTNIDRISEEISVRSPRLRNLG